jgi:hypothetical protein
MDAARARAGFFVALNPASFVNKMGRLRGGALRLGQKLDKLMLKSSQNTYPQLGRLKIQNKWDRKALKFVPFCLACTPVFWFDLSCLLQSDLTVKVDIDRWKPKGP